VNDGPFEVGYTGGRAEDCPGGKLRVIARDGRSLGDIPFAAGLAQRWDGARRR
jgi:hypothetical protein